MSLTGSDCLVLIRVERYDDMLDFTIEYVRARTQRQSGQPCLQRIVRVDDSPFTVGYYCCKALYNRTTQDVARQRGGNKFNGISSAVATLLHYYLGWFASHFLPPTALGCLSILSLRSAWFSLEKMIFKNQMAMCGRPKGYRVEGQPYLHLSRQEPQSHYLEEFEVTV